MGSPGRNAEETGAINIWHESVDIGKIFFLLFRTLKLRTNAWRNYENKKLLRPHKNKTFSRAT